MAVIRASVPRLWPERRFGSLPAGGSSIPTRPAEQLELRDRSGDEVDRSSRSDRGVAAKGIATGPRHVYGSQAVEIVRNCIQIKVLGVFRPSVSIPSADVSGPLSEMSSALPPCTATEKNAAKHPCEIHSMRLERQSESATFVLNVLLLHLSSRLNDYWRK